MAEYKRIEENGLLYFTQRLKEKLISLMLEKSQGLLAKS